jgi:type I restriction enzyme R subunit
LSGADQSKRIIHALLRWDTESNPRPREQAVTVDDRPPFVFEASGSEAHFTNGYDPQPCARMLLAFPRPATLARIVRDAAVDPQRRPGR